MHFMEALRLALHCMRIGRLRTALTMLGIVLSVSLAIVLSALNNGLNNTYQDAFNTLTRFITISPSAAASPGGNSPRLLRDTDVAALKKDGNPSVIAGVVPMIQGHAGMRNGSTVCGATVIGTSSAYLWISGEVLAAGSMFTDEHSDRNARVVVLGSTIANCLFGGNAPAAVGSKILIGRQEFKVIGSLAPFGVGDSAALMPMSAARSYLYGTGHSISAIGIAPSDVSQVSAAVHDVNRIMDEQHDITAPGLRDFSVSAAQLPAAGANVLLEILAWLTVGATGISLFIGTLGLANIMLITVTDRTSEIGIRMAVGARRAAILRQFLIESVLIAGIGGIIGVTMGVSLVMISRQILPSTYGLPVMSINSIGSAFGISLLIGLIAGGYPAMRAARLCPMDALRY
jgi:putative ABC transport system permease protein